MNERIFKRASLLVEDLLHQVFVRKANWASTRNEFDSLRMDDILYNWEVSHLCGPSKVRKVVSWSSPSISVLNLSFKILKV